MKFTGKFERIFRAILPSPFSIALILTLITFLLSFLIKPIEISNSDYTWDLLESWEKELWDTGKLAFAVQMMLMLVLGHVLALTPFISSIINRLTSLCTTNRTAVFYCTLFTIAVSLFNWGLGLIFGAILARKIGEKASREKFNINYPLIAACGYVGLMVWHGGISGSAPIKIVDNGHLASLAKDILDMDQLKVLPDSIGFSETVFSSMNIFVSIALLTLIPFGLSLISKWFPTKIIKLEETVVHSEKISSYLPAEKIDHTRFFSISVGLLILAYIVVKTYKIDSEIISTFKFINPNYINLLLLSLCLIFHRSIKYFLDSLDQAISGTSGILIQFPLYFGIMGLMQASGLIDHISNSMISISSETTFPILTFLSAGIVNIFVPSGGGQWMVQGPIIIKASLELGVPLSKSIMALAYGDQITNMLQPFWALPLLGITKVKAKDILPYTLILFLLGSMIFISALLIY